MPLFSRRPRAKSARREDQASKLYNSIWGQEEYRDLEFICGEDRLRYHQAMVIPHSLFLANLVNLRTCCKGFCSNREEISITLDNVSASIVEIVIGCLYSREGSEVPLEALEDVEQLKNVLGLDNLSVEERFGIEETNNMDIENEYIKQYGDEELKEFACDICNLSFNLSIKLKKHMKIHKIVDLSNDSVESGLESQPSLNRKNEKSFTCPMCNESFNLFIKLKMHMKMHKNENLQNHSDKIFHESKPDTYSDLDTAVEDIKEEIEFIDPPTSMFDNIEKQQIAVISDKMNKIINRFESYVNHQDDQNIDIVKNNAVHQIESNDMNHARTKTFTSKRKVGGGILCSLCPDSKDHKSRSRFLLHLSQSHYLLALKQKFLSSAPGEQLTCRICKVKQTNSTMYMRHIGAIHEMVLEFLSPDMAALVTELPAKKNVQKSAQKGQIYDWDNCICSSCGKVFSTKQTLLVHILSCK